ncbi:hypothetical protein BKA70DRAFT_1472308 [Coprinopsis sp. MPI-PUGE-AT-0042]|nr:hypothetical protein BKA70DRAFT_1472308 [Coprinopsis sp. MPI-PUGE-AT-0042]
MGAAVVAPAAVAPAAVALVGEAGPALAALGAVGPPGWIAAGIGAAVGLVVVAGDEELRDFGCWKRAIGSDALASLSEDKVAFHAEHGMLLPHVLDHCESLQDAEGRLVLKNRLGEHYALSITHELPAHESGPRA